MKWLETRNNGCFGIEDIPVVPYAAFYEQVIDLLKSNESCHCINYFVLEEEDNGNLHCIIVIADDSDGMLYLFSHKSSKADTLKSITAEVYALHVFEREIHERYGIGFEGHPWLKPLRYAHDRAFKFNKIAHYPFFKIHGEDLHQVGVGPIHAGVIEPGHFRFICNGEKVLHLEIQLGYQHRGVENIFAAPGKLQRKIILAESIAGDSVVAHTLPFVMNLEALAGYEALKDLQYSRTIALELERVAVHIGDLSAQCTDIAYQLGSAVFGALRTPIINYFQSWCGNRFSRALIRPFHQPYPLTKQHIDRLLAVIEEFEKKFIPMVEETFSQPSVLGRLEKTGHITKTQMELIGAVGIPARITGVKRDIRHSHPSLAYQEYQYHPYLMHSGDVYAHAYMRVQEIYRGFSLIRRIIQKALTVAETTTQERPKYEDFRLKPNHMAINIVEGWRGETCHITCTNAAGEVVFNKVKDPSMHNWMALALAVRNQEISDFPICNKSFDQSYCGFDL